MTVGKSRWSDGRFIACSYRRRISILFPLPCGRKFRSDSACISISRGWPHVSFRICTARCLPQAKSLFMVDSPFPHFEVYIHTCAVYHGAHPFGCLCSDYPLLSLTRAPGLLLWQTVRVLWVCRCEVHMQGVAPNNDTFRRILHSDV